MAEPVGKSFDQPDDTRSFDKGRIDVVNLGSHTAGRATLEPGWRWSECVKPIVGTDSCQAAHVAMSSPVGFTWSWTVARRSRWATSPSVSLEFESRTAETYAKEG